MAYWLLKTEPDEFPGTIRSRRAPRATPGPACETLHARKNLQAMKKGERAFFYHTGDEKQVVGIVEIIRKPTRTRPTRRACSTPSTRRRSTPVPKPVTLAAIKAEPKLKSMVLVREPRLSVQAVTDEEWKLMCKMGGVKG